jgi:hypothetical protein
MCEEAKGMPFVEVLKAQSLIPTIIFGYVINANWFLQSIVVGGL